MLSERDQRIVDFEGAWFQYPGPKDRTIQEFLGMSASRYYQAIRRLIDDEDALIYAPLTIRRLRKMRDERLAQIAKRVEGTIG